ncbi:hypothetical protein GEK51_02385 [Lacticaseibacillus rhamnosus]|nr:hypothetical protein GEK51_02385 [Lacticaseibacillus rhamnosus]
MLCLAVWGWGYFGFYNAAVGWGLLSETRSQGQKPAHKDLERNGQSPPRPLMLRFLSGPVRALDILSENTDNEKVKM